MAPGNPHAKNPDVPVLEVRVQGSTVGFLTPAMTKRYKPFLDAAEAQGRILTATTVIRPGTRCEQRDRRSRSVCSRCPGWWSNAASPGSTSKPLNRTCCTAALTPGMSCGARFRRASSRPAGRTLPPTEATIVRRTKPYVGWVTDDGAIVDDYGDTCGNCASAPTGGDPSSAHGRQSSRPKPVAPDPGRYGKSTDVTGQHRGRPYSTRMSHESIAEALKHGLDFDVAGESFRPGYPHNLLRLADVLDEIDGPEWVGAVLRRDPNNAYDSHAIEVHVPSGEIGHVGFVPSELARNPRADARLWRVDDVQRRRGPDRQR